jgi:hypothetical protein
MEVLVEYGEARQVLKLTTEDSLESIQWELQKIDEKIILCGSKSSHFLQKWSKKFDCFVNTDDVADFSDGDRITVVCKKGEQVGVSALLFREHLH